MTDTTNTAQLFQRQLQSLQSVEALLTQAIPRMMEKATNFGLKKNLAFHLAETRQHKVAVEAICKELGIEAEGEPNAGLQAIIENGEEEMSAETAGTTLDAAIISSAIKVEQYEIAEYEKAASYALQAGKEGIAKRLRLTQEEERQAKTKLEFLEQALPYQKAQAAPVDV